ncbi:MAG: glutamate-1-semialdehyde 2,1-aminomutase [Halobacteriales archaeon]|nr:glutamate-1-semialdehyde 2,1-aminomutase [Halobacteriales archaeon]
MDETRSRELYDRALEVMPGGVNSSVRAIRPYPAFIDHGDGGHVVDADGNRFIDFVMGYGPLLLGHWLPERVESAITAAANDGPMFGMPTEREVKLAEFVVEHVPSVESIRFVNSGTEATVSAVRLARGYTGREKIVVMDGGYHGANDSTLVEGEPGSVSPSTPGIPQAVADAAIPVPFNDEEALAEVFETHGADIAGVLAEPILGNTGIVTPEPGFHDAIRDHCDDYGSLFVLDEVITGFRVGGLAGAQGVYDIDPDITTFGKVIGGGFPVGAIGGRTEVIESFTPSGDVFQSGTFSGHPVTMAAGLETLRYAKNNDVYGHINDLGDQLRAGLEDIVADRAPDYTVVGRDSMFKVIFTRSGREVKSAADVRAANNERWDRLFRPAMKEQGVLLPANQFESQFVCAAHTEEDIEKTLAAYEAVL